MINSVILQGRIGNDPELKTVGDGIAALTLRLAVERPRTANGAKVSDWFEVKCWRKTAEFVARYFGKGDAIIVQGTLQTRSYQTQDGQNRRVTEVIADQVHFSGSKRERDEFAETSTDELPWE